MDSFTLYILTVCVMFACSFAMRKIFHRIPNIPENKPKLKKILTGYIIVQLTLLGLLVYQLILIIKGTIQNLS